MSHVEDRWKRDPNHSRLRYRARWTDPDGRERSRSFATKGLAERFLTEVEHSKNSGSYRDPDAGRLTLSKYAAQWLAAQGFDAVTREGVELRLRLHVLPALGDNRLDQLAARPSVIQAWVVALPLAPSTARKVFTHLNSIMRAAQLDGLIGRNPCSGLKLPAVPDRTVRPWTRTQATAVRAALYGRLRALVDAGVGLGLRQSELFGLAVDELDFLRRSVHVRQQVKLVGGRAYFASPKGAKERTVPLASHTAEALAAHLAAYPAAEVTLPWWEPSNRVRHMKPHTAALLFATADGRPLHRAAFNSHVWRPAIKAAGLGAGNGCHVMRHTYASTLIARGIDPRTVAGNLGHSDGGALVLKTYSHVLPDADDRTRQALESAFSAEHDGPQTYLRGVNGR